MGHHKNADVTVSLQTIIIQGIIRRDNMKPT